MSVHFSKLTLFLPLVYDTAWHPQLNVFSLCQKDVIGCPAHIPAVYVGSADISLQKENVSSWLNQRLQTLFRTCIHQTQCLEKMRTAKDKARHTDSDFFKEQSCTCVFEILPFKFCASLTDNSTTFGILELGPSMASKKCFTGAWLDLSLLLVLAETRLVCLSS